MKTLALVLLLSLPSLGQTFTFVDDSPSDSPLAWRGTATFDQNMQGSCALTAHNRSGHLVVAYKVEFDVVRPDGQLATFQHRHDHFFKPQDMLAQSSPQPLQDFVPPENAICADYLGANETPTTAAPSAHIKTIFAQFDDGTVWGNATVAQDIMQQRTAAIAFLQTLAQAYASGGADGLAAVTKKGPGRGQNRESYPVALTELHQIRQLPDAASQANYINADLSIAASRAAWLK